MFCHNCGAENNKDAKFCMKCGSGIGGIPGIKGNETTEKLGSCPTGIQGTTMPRVNIKPKKMSGVIKALLIMFCSFIGIAVVIAVIAALSGDTSTETPAKPSVLYYRGDTLKTDKLSFVVSNIDRKDRIGGYIENIWVGYQGGVTPSEGATFLTMQYKYKNVSNEAIGMFSNPTVSLYSPSGMEYKIDVNAYTALATEIGDDENIISDLNPGITVKSCAAFEVATEQLKQPGWFFIISVDGSEFKVAVNDRPKPQPALKPPVVKEIPSSVMDSGIFVMYDAAEGANLVTVKPFSTGENFYLTLAADVGLVTHPENYNKKVRYTYQPSTDPKIYGKVTEVTLME